MQDMNINCAVSSLCPDIGGASCQCCTHTKFPSALVEAGGFCGCAADCNGAANIKRTSKQNAGYRTQWTVRGCQGLHPSGFNTSTTLGVDSGCQL